MKDLLTAVVAGLVIYWVTEGVKREGNAKKAIAEREGIDPGGQQAAMLYDQENWFI